MGIWFSVVFIIGLVGLVWGGLGLGGLGYGEGVNILGGMGVVVVVE